jgi:hypothetical protein
MVAVTNAFVPEPLLDAVGVVPHWPLRAVRSCGNWWEHLPPASTFATNLLAGGFVTEVRFPLRAVTSLDFPLPSYQLVAVNIDLQSRWPPILASSEGALRWQLSPPTPGTFLSSRGGAPGPIEGIPPLTDEITPYCRIQSDAGFGTWTACHVDGRGIWE